MKRAWVVLLLGGLTSACGDDRDARSEEVGDGEPSPVDESEGEELGGEAGSEDDGGGGPGEPDTAAHDDAEGCGAPTEHVPCDAWGGSATPLQAIGLDCAGTPNEATQTSASSFTSPDPRAWQIAAQFGSSGDWIPSEGETLLVISTGRISEPDADGMIINDANEHSTDNPDEVGLPAPMTAQPGSNAGAGGTPFQACDGVGDCSDSLPTQWQLGGGEAFDLLWFDFSVAVPAMTTGWKLDLVYFSNEFPEYVHSTFNDILVVWEVSETYVGNVCFVAGQPCTVTALDAIADAFSGPNEADHPSLAGTGTDGSGSTGGQTTGWVVLEGPASPGETIGLTFALFDMGDGAFDTIVVIDNWRWSCGGCTPNEVSSCGVQPQ